jgi:hypothetical protein
MTHLVIQLYNALQGDVPAVTIFVCNGFAVSLARYAASRGLTDFGPPLEYAVVETLISLIFVNFSVNCGDVGKAKSQSGRLNVAGVAGCL